MFISAITKHGKKAYNNKLVLFIGCNALFSGSTFALNIAFPFLFSVEMFNEVVYLFQMIILMNTITGLGLTTGLLRNHKLNKKETYSFFYFSALVVSLFLFLISFFSQNPFSVFIEVNELSFFEHFLFYLAVILSNLFFFNRGFLNADNKMNLFFNSTLIISLLRFIALIFIAFLYNGKSLGVIMLVLFILPYIFELQCFAKRLRFIKFRELLISRLSYGSFLRFSLTVFTGGALFIVADRLFLIRLKSNESDFAAILSFAYGFMGVISILNMSFSNYFLGKLNPTDITSIKEFRNKINRKTPHFILFTILVIITICGLVYKIYPRFGITGPILIAILIAKTAIVSFLGFTNLLTKTLDILKFDIAINVLRLIGIIIVLHYTINSGVIITLSIVSFIMVVGELGLKLIVNKKISKLKIQ